jgi:hypothetical protein
MVLYGIEKHDFVNDVLEVMSRDKNPFRPSKVSVISPPQLVLLLLFFYIGFKGFL